MGLHAALEVEWVLDVADDINHMHNKLVIHKDIKAENVLVGSDLKLKVIVTRVICMFKITNRCVYPFHHAFSTVVRLWIVEDERAWQQCCLCHRCGYNGVHGARDPQW